ncbi:trypco2 family protein [Nocardia sp. NPDC020380]|uniref:trypco2 family protein n=1 Tax=Nocardia sp. NPDC020380 TaxID=3364309 RepID=UPI0037922EAD
MKGRVPLSDAIDALRSELVRSWEGAQSETLRFKPTTVELTLQVAVTSTGKAQGGIKWWLVEAGAEASRQSAATQTVKMTLEPVTFSANGQRAAEVFIDAVREDSPLHSTDPR